ncbi:MAG: hypothetical protein AAF740_01755 [Bacteroidota bacterium]
MRRIILFILAYFCLNTITLQAQELQDSTQLQKLIKRVSVGGLVHFVGVGLQDRPTAAEEASADYESEWLTSFNVYRARVLLNVALTNKTNFFLETEIPTIIGRQDGNGGRRTQVRPIILDAQIEHTFSNHFGLIAGMQLVGITRNQLQSAAALMALDFGYFQYSYSLFETQPLQNNFGRDVGVNTRGFLANDRLEYRLGVFNGRSFDERDPFRFVGRLNFNFWEREKDLYYTGTSLGEHKRLSLGGGVDVQGSYLATGLDLFLDVPTGKNGALTLNTSVTYMTGGTDTSLDSFREEIPQQMAYFLELGHYFKKSKLLPYVKYERQDINAVALQNTTPLSLENFNTFFSNERAGIGLGYFFHDYNTNLKVSYENVQYGRSALAAGEAESNRISEIWVQLQFFFL